MRLALKPDWLFGLSWSHIGCLERYRNNEYIQAWFILELHLNQWLHLGASLAVWIAQKTINTSMHGAYYMCGFNWIIQLMFFHLASCSVVSVQTYFVAFLLALLAYLLLCGQPMI